MLKWSPASVTFSTLNKKNIKLRSSYLSITLSRSKGEFTIIPIKDVAKLIFEMHTPPPPTGYATEKGQSVRVGVYR